MEGNIEFRQGDRVVYAGSMFYDVRAESGIVLDAELLTPVREFDGKVRLKADVIRQYAKDRFVIEGARITTSRLGEPS